MKFKSLTKEQKVVLDRIQDSIPSYLTDSVSKTEKVAPAMREMLEKGLNDTEFSEESRKKFQMILDSGYLDQERTVEQPEIAAEIEAYVELEIAKAILRKELPRHRRGKLSYEKLYKQYNDIKQYNDKKFKRSS